MYPKLWNGHCQQQRSAFKFLKGELTVDCSSYILSQRVGDQLAMHMCGIDLLHRLRK